MRVTAIVVNYFTSGFLKPLLSVLSGEPDISEIVIADNSGEPGLSSLAGGCGRTRVVSFGGNLGFAAAVNRVAESADAEWFLVINPDTLPDRGFVAVLLGSAEETGALIAGPRFYWDVEKTFLLPPSQGNSLWLQAALGAAQRSEVESRLLSFYWAMRHERFRDEKQAFFEPFLSGACMLIRNDRSFFPDGKIFDERFFLYCEDDDLCLRALLANKLMVCVPDAQVVHYWNQSPSDKKGSYFTEACRLFMEKHGGAMLPPLKFSGLQDSPANEIPDLGEVTASPMFQYEGEAGISGLFFELALNPVFIPFAQAPLDTPAFRIPEGIWKRMPPGDYWGRIRNRLNQVSAQWKWKKI